MNRQDAKPALSEAEGNAKNVFHVKREPLRRLARKVYDRR